MDALSQDTSFKETHSSSDKLILASLQTRSISSLTDNRHEDHNPASIPVKVEEGTRMKTETEDGCFTYQSFYSECENEVKIKTENKSSADIHEIPLEFCLSVPGSLTSMSSDASSLGRICVD